MVKTYNKKAEGRTKVFFVINEDGEVVSTVIGNNSIIDEEGHQFYVDDYVAEQSHKLDLYLDGVKPRVKVKDGEELNIPSEVEEKEKEIKRLEKQLRELKGEEDAE